MAIATAVSELTAHDIAAVHRMIEPWSQACIARNWDALLSMCTDDVAFLPPNRDVIQGDAVRPFLESYPIIKAMSWDIRHMEGRGDFGALRGGVKMTLLIDGQEVQFDGKYTDTMRKEADGNWRFASITFNSNS